MRRPNNPLALGSAVQYLLIINLAVYAVQVWFNIQTAASMGRPIGLSIMGTWFELTFGLRPIDVLRGEVWQPFTYMFLHGGIWHIGFNMLALWMFGQILERVWGMRRFFQYYLFCGVGAGLSVFLVALITGDGMLGITIGASGSVLGLLLAFGMLFPEQIIYLYFFPVKAKYAVIIFGALSLFFAVSGSLAGISHVGHLGGILFGLLFLKGRAWWLQLTQR